MHGKWNTKQFQQSTILEKEENLRIKIKESALFFNANILIFI